MTGRKIAETRLPILIPIVLIMISAVCSAQVKIIGHRGYSYIAPENTRASAMLAWENKADGVEVDIYLTGDNKVICSHDASTRRTSGTDYRISETDSKILRKLDVGSFKDPKYKGERMPFLEEIIRTMPEKGELVVEIKCGAEVLPFLKKTIGKYNQKRKFTFICFDLATITETKKVFPANECYWLCSNRELLDRNFTAVKESGLNGVSLSWNIIDSDVMKKASGLSLDVCSWTVDSPDEARRLIGLGVRAVTTNRPGWLREQLSVPGM